MTCSSYVYALDDTAEIIIGEGDSVYLSTLVSKFYREGSPGIERKYGELRMLRPVLSCKHFTQGSATSPRDAGIHRALSALPTYLERVST